MSAAGGFFHEAARRRRTAESELVSIDSVHQNIHDGILFSSGANVPDLANGASLEALFVVAGGAHLQPRIEIGGDGTFEAFENTTVSANGVAVPSFNRNRFSVNVATSVLFTAPTITADGDSLGAQLVFGGQGPKAVGGEATFFREWLLSPGNYLLRLTNTSGNPQGAQFFFDWYEKGGP